MSAPSLNNGPGSDRLYLGGELGALIRGYDWRRHPLGSIESWPNSLVGIVNTMINSRLAKFLFWGDEFISFYNDAAIPVLGTTKHPEALGSRGEDVWHEIWADVGEQLRQVQRTGEAIWCEDRLLPYDRLGYIEEIYITYSYSPIFSDNGDIGGVLSSFMESTGRVLTQRRLLTVSEGAALKLPTGSADSVAGAFADVLSRNRRDAPFFICCDTREPGQVRKLATMPAQLSEDASTSGSLAPVFADAVASALATGAAVVVEDIAGQDSGWANDETAAAARSAVVLPVTEPFATTPRAVAILGVNPLKALDEAYWQFLGLLTAQMGVAFGAATALEREAARVADLQASEKAMRELLNNIIAMVGILTPDGVVVEVNDMPLRLAGIERADVIGRPFWECHWWTYDEDAQRTLRDTCERAARGEASRYDVAVRMAGDRRMTTDFMLAPLTDARGTVTRLIASAFDITERVRTMRELASARHQADVANRTKSEFLANISHEIRSPLSAILGYAEILESELTDSGERQYVTTIYESGQHLLGLVNDILDLSRIEAGRLEVFHEPFELRSLLEGLHAAFTPAADEKGLELSIASVSEVPAIVVGDVRRIRQILVNLLSNAVKFTAAGAVGMEVAWRADDDRTQLSFCVYDTGPGISDAQQTALFQAFSQLDGTDTRVHGGAGLGLAISRHLATLLGGTVTIESTPGAGSRFTLQVPATAGAATTLIPARTDFADHAAATIRRRPIPRLSGRILAVDDRRDMRFLVADYLESAGAAVTAAASAAEAFSRIEEAAKLGETFDAVIMDIQMPEMDGYEATTALRARGFDAPIIALTASAMKGEKERCLAAGCSAYLTKPVERARLVETVATAIHDPGPREPALSSPARARSVLVVEDDENAAGALTKLLQLKGFEVTTALDGATAIRYGHDSSFDVAVIDITLPDISGVEVANTLRANAGSRAPICIALSGLGRDSAGRPSGVFDHHLVKPVAIEELIALLDGVDNGTQTGTRPRP